MKTNKIIACIVCSTLLLGNIPVNAAEYVPDENQIKNIEELAEAVETDEKETVVSTRLIVKSEKTINTDTAFTIIHYDDIWILNYENETICNESYENFLNENVLVSKDYVLETASQFSQTSEETGIAKETAQDKETNLFPKEYGDKEVLVAVIDTGYSGDNSDRVIQDEDTADENGHGTQMIDNILNNTSDSVKVESIKALNENGKGSVIDVYISIKKAIEDKADVINLSLAAKADEQSEILSDIINEASDKGIEVVVAAGNYNDDTKNYSPANTDSAIVVGASDEYGNRQSLSDYGDTLDYLAYSSEGTSAACTLVTSMIANLISNNQEINLLKYANDKGETGWDKYYGNGVLTYSLFEKASLDIKEPSDIITPPGGSFVGDMTVTSQTAYALNLYFGYPDNGGNQGAQWMSTWTEENNTATSFTMPQQFSWMLNGFYDGWQGAYGAMYYNSSGTGTHVVNVNNTGNIIANWNTTYASRIFDAGQYMTLNPDIYNAYGGNAYYAWLHYLLYGMNEGRASAFEFNAQEYGALYGDLKTAYGSNMWQYAMHYAKFGKAEGRFGSYNNTYFNGNGGTPSYSSKYTSYGHYMCDYYNHSAASQQYLPTASRTGYTFLGWFTAASGGTQVSDWSVCNNYTDFTLYAHWQINSYTITVNHYKYDCNTNSWVYWTKGTTSGAYGSSYTPSYTTTPSGYYNYSKDGAKTITGATTFSVYYYPNNYTMTSYHRLYNTSTATWSTWKTTTATARYGTTYTPAYVTPPSGYYAYSKDYSSGWTVAGNGGFNVNYYPTAYSITLDLDAGSATWSSKSYDITSVTITLPTPTKTNFEFVGWTGANGTVPQKTVTIATGSTGNKSYTANWKLMNFTVTFDANKGTCSTASKEVTYNQTYGELPIPERTGYEFDGWYTAIDGGEAITAESIYSNMSDTTLYAHWTLIPISVTIPKELIIDANSNTCTFKITADNKCGTVTVSTPGMVSMTQNNKNQSVSAQISLDKNTITPDSPTIIGRINTDNLSAGTWSADFNFTITFSAE